MQAAWTRQGRGSLVALSRVQVRTIGLSNYNIAQLQLILDNAWLKPSVLQARERARDAGDGERDVAEL